MASIFDIEKRLQLSIECHRINEFIKKNRFQVKNDNSFHDLYEVIDEFLFIKWKFRHTATCISEYIEYFDIDFNFFIRNKPNLSDEKCLFFLETLVNLIFYIENDLRSYSHAIVRYYDPIKITNFIASLTQNIELVLDANNLKMYIENSDMIRFTKRDADVDAAIISIQDKDTALDVLSFLDYRNVSNINEKKSIITRLYKHLEANQSTYKSIRIKSSVSLKDINPYDDFFMLANKFDIRHHPKELLKNGTLHKLDDKRTLEVLEICFRLFLRIINTNQAAFDQDYINNLKQEFNII